MTDFWQNYKYNTVSTEVDGKGATVFPWGQGFSLKLRSLCSEYVNFSYPLQLYCQGDDQISTRVGSRPIPV